jgi:cholinesterase
VSVDFYQYAWTERPIVQGFIQESGTAQSFYNPPPSNNLGGWWNASLKLGCGGQEVPLAQQVDCIRTKDFRDIETAIQIADPLKAVLGSFAPTVDGRVVFGDYSARGAAGAFIRKPLLIGNNYNEAGLFKVFALAGGDNITEQQWALFNQALFQCPISTAAGYRVQNGVDVWRYLYFGDFPNMDLTSNPPSGAYHTSEIPIVFETAPDTSGLPNTAAETSISKYLNRAWASFAKNPHDALSSERYRLPEYDPSSKLSRLHFP